MAFQLKDISSVRVLIFDDPDRQGLLKDMDRKYRICISRFLLDLYLTAKFCPCPHGLPSNLPSVENQGTSPSKLRISSDTRHYTLFNPMAMRTLIEACVAT